MGTTRAVYAVHLKPGDVIHYIGDASNTYELCEIHDVLHEFDYKDLPGSDVEVLLKFRGEVIRQSYDINECVDVVKLN